MVKKMKDLYKTDKASKVFDGFAKPLIVSMSACIGSCVFREHSMILNILMYLSLSVFVLLLLCCIFVLIYVETTNDLTQYNYSTKHQSASTHTTISTEDCKL